MPSKYLENWICLPILRTVSITDRVGVEIPGVKNHRRSDDLDETILGFIYSMNLIAEGESF